VKLRDFINIALRPLGSILRRPGWGDDWQQDIPSILSTDGEWCILDCGANEGQTLDQMRPIFPRATFHAFEPYPPTFATLQKNWGNHPNISLHPLALSHENGSAEFFINEDSATNSLLSNAAAGNSHPAPQSSVTVDQKTLDTFTQEHQIKTIDLLKMDCQGYELQILKGASELLAAGRIHLIYSEVLFTPLYRGQAYFDELSAFLRGVDYHLLALYDGRRSPQGHLLWSNALFSRKA
jgi:FkbM family methyltransferase